MSDASEGEVGYDLLMPFEAIGAEWVGIIIGVDEKPEV